MWNALKRAMGRVGPLIMAAWALPAWAVVDVNKSFTPINVLPGQTSVVEITLFNSNQNFPITNVALTDVLPTNLSASTVTLNECGGTVSLVPATQIGVSGATIPQGSGGNSGICRIRVQVSGTVAGTYVNSIAAGDVTGLENGVGIANPLAAQATLTISALAPLTGTKTRSPTTIHIGGLSTFTITVTNPNAVPLIGLAFTDNLPTPLILATPLTTGGTCVTTGGGTVTAVAGGTSAALSGANLGASSSCTVTLAVTVDPASNATFRNGTVTNSIPIGAITTTQGVSNTAAISATLTVQSGAEVAKAFAPSTLFLGQSSTLTLTLRNYNNVAITGVNFTDVMPAGIEVTGPVSTTCGGTASFTATDVSLTGGTVPAAPNLNASSFGSCTITATVHAIASGAQVNSIPAGNLNGINHNSATATLNVIELVSLAKSFSPGTVAQGGSTTLTIVLSNAGGVNANINSFADNLTTMGTGFTIGAGASNTCGGTLTATPGTTLISMTGGVVPAGGNCRIVVPVNVAANASTNTRTNTIAAGAMDTDLGDNPTAVTATLTVNRTAGLTKTFSPGTVAPGGTSTLILTVTRAAGANALSNITLTDPLPAGHLIAAVPNAFNSCGGTLTATAGTGTISLTGGALAGGVASTSCQIRVDVVAPNSIGSATNTIVTANFSASDGTNSYNNGGNATATLTRQAASLIINKAFNPVSANGGAGVEAQVTISNNQPGAIALSNVTLSDSLPPNVFVYSVPGASFSGSGCTGGTITAVPGANSFALTGASIAVNAVCDFRVRVTSSFDGNHINTIPIGTLTSKENVSNSNEVSATLTVQRNVNISKSFSPRVIVAGGQSLLTLRMFNTNTAARTLTAAAGVSDTLPAGMTIKNPLLPGDITTTCSGPAFNAATDILATGGGNSIVVNDVELLSYTACDVVVPVTVAAIGNYVNTIPASSMNTVEGSTNPDPATDTLTAITAASISKSFAPASIAVGGISTITFTLTNPNTALALPGGLTGASFSDTLTGMQIASNQAAAGTCAGANTHLLTAGQTSLNFSGLTIPGGSPGTCTVTVTVTALAAGVYPNVASNLVTQQTPTPVSSPSVDLTVVAGPPTISKSFSPDPIALGQASTLTFTLSNPNAVAVTLPSDAFRDVFPTLPAAMTVATPLTTTNNCGGTLVDSANGTLAAGDVGIRYNGGSIPASSSCTLSVNVTTAASGTFSNTSTVLTSSNAGSSLSPATDTLTVDPPILNVTKSVTPDPVPHGSPAVYTVIVSNTAAQARTIGNLTITDQLGPDITLNNTTGSDAGWSCSGTSALVCTYPNSLLAGTSTTLLLNVSVGAGALNADNTARVSGGGDPLCPAAPLIAASRCSGSVLASTVPVVISDLKASIEGPELVVRFGTAAEMGTLGFRILAGATGVDKAPVNVDLIRASSGSLGARRYEARGPYHGQTAVWVEEITTRGASIVYGPFPVGDMIGSADFAAPIDWAPIRAEQTSFRRAQVQAFRATAGSSVAELHVDRSGWTTLSHADLLAQGIDWSGRPADQLRLRQGPTEVPLDYSGPALFGPGSSLRFLAKAIEGSLYTKTAVYQLDAGAAGVPLAPVWAAPQGAPITAAADRYEHAPNRLYSAASPGNEPWYARDGYRNGATTAVNESFTLPEKAIGSEAIEVELWGAVDFPQNPDHSVRLLLNGQAIASTQFDGLSRKLVRTSLPPGLLQGGNNTLTLELVADTGLQYDLVQLEAIRIDYVRTLRAVNDRLHFSGAAVATSTATQDRLYADAFDDLAAAACAQPQDCDSYRVSGLSRSDVVVLRERDGRVERLTGARVSGANGDYSVEFASTRHSGDQYWIEPAGGNAVAALLPTVAVSDPLAGAPAQLLIIAHPSLIDGLAPLVSARQAEGYSVRVLDVEDLYRHYNGGVVDPQSIRQAIADAYARLGTRYVLLVGGDTYDYHNLTGANSVSLIPTFYRPTDAIIRFGAADSVYADPTGDGYSDVALGRFPVRTRAELDAIVAKTLSYAQAHHAGKLLLQADRADPLEYDQQLSVLATQFGPAWTTTTLSLDEHASGTAGTQAARGQLTAAVNAGQALMAYLGHSSPDRWTHSGLLSAADVYGGFFNNPNKPTVLWNLGCYGAYFTQPSYNTIAHAMMLQGNGGAAAVIGASGLTQVSSDVAWINMMVLYLPGERLGDALMYSQRLLRGSGAQFDDISVGATLLGDPTLRLRQ